MLIEIESAYGDQLLHGTKMGQEELRRWMQRILEITEEEHFAAAFCALTGYEVIAYDPSAEVDYVIDLDTHLIFQPKRRWSTYLGKAVSVVEDWLEDDT